ncbi:MAG: hypothetical protein RIC14_05490 [Filomicrobium sp.]
MNLSDLLTVNQLHQQRFELGMIIKALDEGEPIIVGSLHDASDGLVILPDKLPGEFRNMLGKLSEEIDDTLRGIDVNPDLPVIPDGLDDDEDDDEEEVKEAAE